MQTGGTDDSMRRTECRFIFLCSLFMKQTVLRPHERVKADLGEKNKKRSCSFS